MFLTKPWAAVVTDDPGEDRILGQVIDTAVSQVVEVQQILVVGNVALLPLQHVALSCVLCHVVLCDTHIHIYKTLTDLSVSVATCTSADGILCAIFMHDKEIESCNKCCTVHTEYVRDNTLSVCQYEKISPDRVSRTPSN